MILTITIILTFLVALNFILLFTSCNKTTKKKSLEKPYVNITEKSLAITNQSESGQLAPTGS